MLDHPSPVEILMAATTSLRDSIVPVLAPAEAFRLRIILNAIGLVIRELEYEKGSGPTDELHRLQAILGSDDDCIPSLTKQLCARVTAGDVSFEDDALMEHLWLTTIDKIEVDQPQYAGYKQALEMLRR